MSFFVLFSQVLYLQIFTYKREIKEKDGKRKNKAALTGSSEETAENVLPEVIEETLPEKEPEKPETEPELIEKTYKISGMMCGHCEGRVKAALEAIPGVSEAVASCLHDNAVVKMTAEIPDETLREAIEKAGYHLE